MAAYMHELRRACADWKSPTVRVWHVAVILGLALPMGLVGVILGDTVGADRASSVLVAAVGALVWTGIFVALRRRLANRG